MIHYSDHLEKMVGEALERLAINFIHESHGDTKRKDFYLPDHNVYIEVKQFYSERAVKQLDGDDNVILPQGKAAVGLFCSIIKSVKQ